MSTRCKFYCSSIEKDSSTIWDNKKNAMISTISYNLELIPVISGSEENKQFFNSTPDGHFKLNIINAEAAKIFEIGKEYYIDITLAN